MEIIKTDISDRLLDLNSPKPSFYIEVVFKEEVDSFDYLFIKNFYTSSITMKQFDASKTEDNDWVPVLDRYRLMENNEWDFDAEKIHLIDKKFFVNMNTERLKYLRIYLNQESEKWKNFGISDIKFIKINEKDQIQEPSPSFPFQLPNKGLNSTNSANFITNKEEINQFYVELMKVKNQKDINLITFK